MKIFKRIFISTNKIIITKKIEKSNRMINDDKCRTFLQTTLEKREKNENAQ